MSIRYELDDLRRRVVVTAQGPFQTDDVLAIMARQRAEHTWTYGILYDLRVAERGAQLQSFERLLFGEDRQTNEDAVHPIH
jgi:hypothetical protein